MTKKKHKAQNNSHKKIGKEIKEEIDYKNKYLRALADYQNLVKRTRQEKEDYIRYANESFIEKLLPISDHLERASYNIKDHGIELIYKELQRIFNMMGVSRIKIKKTDEFNPEYMECIEAEQGGKHLIEIRAGYKFGDKVIRPTQVKVVK